jgi:DNA-directed RNA polymerase
LEEKILKSEGIHSIEVEEQLYGAACYVAVITMDAMGQLFKEARGIMQWLGNCASVVAVQGGQPMSWMSPLGLPIVQPYRREKQQQIRTAFQHIVIADNNDQVSG